MGSYFESYTLRQKLDEYAVLSARKESLEKDLLNYINEDTLDLFKELGIGKEKNILKIGDIVDNILKKLS